MTKINEVTEKVANIPAMEAEIAEIKRIADQHGYEYFSSMPFTAYDNDPQSVELLYPYLFKVAKAFFKEMQVVPASLMKEDPEAYNDELDINWDSIDQADWDTIMEAAEQVIGNRTHNAQIEKIYKGHFDDGINDRAVAEPVHEELDRYFKQNLRFKIMDLIKHELRGHEATYDDIEEVLELIPNMLDTDGVLVESVCEKLSNDEIDTLIDDELEAIDGYSAMEKDQPEGSPEGLVLDHIKQEEEEHIGELASLKEEKEPESAEQVKDDAELAKALLLGQRDSLLFEEDESEEEITVWPWGDPRN